MSDSAESSPRDGRADSRGRGAASGLRLIMAVVFELAVFPWQTVKASRTVRRLLIVWTAVFGAALAALALANGAVGIGLGAIVVFGAQFLLLAVADRRIEQNRRADEARRPRRTPRG